MQNQNYIATKTIPVVNTPVNVVYVHKFVTSAVFTIIVETLILLVLVYFLHKRKLIKEKINLYLQVFAGIFASFATIPYVWYIFPNLLFPSTTLEQSYNYSEPFVFLVEAIFYKFILRLPTKYALLISFVANVASYLIGPILRSLGIWFYW